MTKKKIIIIIVSVLCSVVGISFLAAFEWAQKPMQTNSFFSQMRGDTFNSGVVFSNSGEVYAAESGEVIMMLKNDQASMGWFDSPLGNAVIVAHKNDMLSVYSNLINVKIESEKKKLGLGDLIGVSGHSAWASSGEGAGFQIIDTKMKTFINPVVLMQEAPVSRRVAISGVKATDRSGETYSLYNGAILKAGAYTLYMERPETGMLHSSSVSLNGEVKESVNYDTLGQKNNSLVLYGNKSYTYKDVYPDENTMRLAEVLLPRGTNTIEISLRSVGNTQTFARYRISVN